MKTTPRATIPKVLLIARKSSPNGVRGQERKSELPATKKSFNDAKEAEMTEMSSVSQSEFFNPEGKTPQEIANWSRKYERFAKKALKDSCRRAAG
jgi:hypothetical protein